MSNPKTCSNVQILDIEKGIIIPASRAYHEQTPQYINTGNSTFHLKDDLVPVPGCAEGNCLESDCPEGRELAYLSLISHVKITAPSAGQLSVELTAAMFDDNLNAIPEVPVYKIDLGDGVGYHNIVVGGTYTLDVSGFANGDYSGNIIEENSGAQFDFFYSVAGGVVENFMRERIATLAINLSCDLYPNYSIELTDYMAIQNPGSSSYKATEAEVKIFDNIVDAETFIGGGVASYNTGGTLETDLVNIPAPQNLVNSAQLNTIGQIQNIGKLITQCINS